MGRIAAHGVDHYIGAAVARETLHLLRPPGIAVRQHAVRTRLAARRGLRWVADERWHSQQQGRFLPDGRYELKVPYSGTRELLMDVLNYGSDAEIVEPPALREQVRALLQLAMSHYDQ